MGTQLVLGLPDVLGDHERVWADWHVSDSIDVVRRHYDRVWVYGDPHVFDPVAEHGLPRDVRRMTRYTGYLDGSRADPAAATARARTIRAEHRLGDGPRRRLPHRRQRRRRPPGRPRSPRRRCPRARPASC